MTTLRFKPIETRYAGHRFRSRIEARWAIFFDTLDLRWEYEREGYTLDGDRYLPDFWLPELNLWAEIKGVIPNDREVRLAGLLAESTQSTTVIFAGDMPTIRGALPDPLAMSVWSPVYARYEHAWAECEACGELRIAYVKHAHMSCACAGYVSPPWIRFDSPRLVNAYTAARSARFEHGEVGR